METTNERVENTNGKPSECEVLGAVITFGVKGFWFGIGAILTGKMVQSLEYCIEELKDTK